MVYRAKDPHFLAQFIAFFAPKRNKKLEVGRRRRRWRRRRRKSQSVDPRYRKGRGYSNGYGQKPILRPVPCRIPWNFK